MNSSERAGAAVRPGDVLAGKYRVERVLGEGGMGVVVAAHHLQLDERVALKFLLPRALENPDAVARFVREARAAAKIKSEHVARVSDVGQLEDGSPFMVMEYLEGSDLAAWLRLRGPLPVELAAEFVLHVCEAMADAHAIGIVHRDLKPANLFCVRRSDGRLSIKVLDFGISKITVPGAPGHDMTRTSALLGSPFYMSPEQMRVSKGVDLRTDIWSIGVILFELVTGRVPFEAEAATELAIKVTNEPAPPMRAFRADVPAALEPIVARCLEKDRALRFQSVGELAVAIQDLAPPGARISVERALGTLRNAGLSESGAARPGAASSSALSGGPVTAASWGNTAAGIKPRAKAALVATGALVVALAAIGAVAVARRSAGRTNEPSGAAVIVSGPISSAAPLAPSAAASSGALAVLAEPASAAPEAGGPVANTPSARPTATPAANANTVAPPASARPAAAPPPASPPSARPNCDPPYYYDRRGNRIFKPECPL